MDEALERFKQRVESAEMDVDNRFASIYVIVLEMAKYLISKEEQRTNGPAKDMSSTIKSAYAEKLGKTIEWNEKSMGWE